MSICKQATRSSFMRYASVCFLGFILTGCPTRPPASCPTGMCKDGSTVADAAREAEARDGAEEGMDGGAEGTIRLVSPAAMTYANGEVAVEVQVAGAAPASVELLRNGVAWMVIEAPFKHSWNTRADPEGEYLLSARATTGGREVTADPVMVTVDRTPPTVTELLPARGSASVDTSAPIKMTFSEPVAPTTVTDASVQLAVAGTPLAAMVLLAADGKSLTLSAPDLRSVTLPAAFTAVLAATIADRAGNGIAPLASAWTWTVPAWVTLPPLPTVLPPRLAVGPDRRPVVIYVSAATVNSTSVYDVHLARYESGQWNTAMGAPTSTRDTGRNGYSLALDSKGQPVVAWTQAGAGQVNVHVGMWNGSTWNNAFPPLDAVTDVSRNASAPSVRVDGSDRPVVAWKEITSSGGTTDDVFVAGWTGTEWSRLNGMGFAGGLGFVRLSGGPELALDSQGNPVFGWYSATGDGSGVATRTASTWTKSVSLTGGFMPYPVLDALGAPLVAVKSTTLRVLKWGGASWEDAVPTPLTTSSSWQAPRLALAPDGSPVVAWLDTSVGVRLGVATWAGGQWDTKLGLFNAGQNPLNTTVPELVVDGGGKIWVAWMEGTAIQVWKSNY
jgi:hypothetical protein